MLSRNTIPPLLTLLTVSLNRVSAGSVSCDRGNTVLSTEYWHGVGEPVAPSTKTATGSTAFPDHINALQFGIIFYARARTFSIEAVY
jgi:hypothetical protein